MSDTAPLLAPTADADAPMRLHDCPGRLRKVATLAASIQVLAENLADTPDLCGALRELAFTIEGDIGVVREGIEAALVAPVAALQAPPDLAGPIDALACLAAMLRDRPDPRSQGLAHLLERIAAELADVDAAIDARITAGDLQRDAAHRGKD